MNSDINMMSLSDLRISLLTGRKTLGMNFIHTL
jgi:hypothetical protein